MASPKFEIAGTVYAKPPPRDGRFYSFVVKTEADSKYPQHVPFDCKEEIAAKVQVGDEVTVSFNLRGREWKNERTGEIKFFGGVQAWRVDVTKHAGAQPPPEPNGGGWGGSPPSDADDLPFLDCSLHSEPSAISPALRRLT
jgi:hypothetical protein